MDKLIELIIEFQKEIWQTTYDLDMYHYDDKLKLIIIWSDVSKWFIDYIDIFRLLFAPWFIKWLVENDKIDRDKFKEKNWTHWMRKLNKRFNVIWEWMIDWEDYSDLESILMILSISDSPIDFLIQILK